MFETIKNECDETDKEIVEDIINKDLSMLKEHVLELQSKL